MKLFWIEGLILSGSGTRRKSAPAARPFSQSFWANSAQEAIQMAYDAAPGVRWMEGPSIQEKSEEQRMRDIGAPELFTSPRRVARKKPAKK